MGLSRSVKAEQHRKDAARARASNRRVMVVKLNYPAMSPDLSGEVPDWSVAVEAIESEGWLLCNLVGMTDRKGHPEILCLFRMSSA